MLHKYFCGCCFYCEGNSHSRPGSQNGSVEDDTMGEVCFWAKEARRHHGQGLDRSLGWLLRSKPWACHFLSCFDTQAPPSPDLEGWDSEPPPVALCKMKQWKCCKQIKALGMQALSPVFLQALLTPCTKAKIREASFHWVGANELSGVVGHAQRSLGTLWGGYTVNIFLLILPTTPRDRI